MQSILAERLKDENIHVGPSDYVPWLNDNKLCFLRLEGSLFGNVPIIKNNFGVVTIAIIVISLLPLAWGLLQSRRSS